MVLVSRAGLAIGIMIAGSELGRLEAAASEARRRKDELSCRDGLLAKTIIRTATNTPWFSAAVKRID
jgi:hypothetical protein